MSAPYFAVGDANLETAFLTNAQGFDIATLHRVLPDEVQDPQHKAECLSDEDWQRVIDLVDAAPKLLAALERIVGEHADLGELDLSNDERDALDQARDAIAKAKGTA